MEKIIEQQINDNHVKKKSKFIRAIGKHKKKIIMLILLCIIIYIAYMVIQLVENPTDTVYVEMGQIQQEESAVGYIIRDETVLKGKNYKNGIEQIKTEGEKVAKDQEIFRYYSNNEGNLVKKIQDLDKKIDEAMNNKENTVLPSDTKLLQQQIDTKIYDLYGESDLTKIKESKQEINNNMTKIAKITGEKSPAGSYLKKLIDQRSKYENQLNSGSEYLTATRSGVVSYRVDGYEDILTPDDFSKYTKQFLNDLNLKTGQIIPSSSESGKIIDNYYAYIVTVLDSENAKNIEVGDSVKIRLPSGTETEATIEYKLKEDSDYVLTLRIEENISELIEYRKISFSIIWWSDTGMKIPNSAISYENKNNNEIAYVTRKRIEYEDKILIKILKSNDRYSVVTNYTSDELKELGYSSEEIRNMPNISIYDEILINK